MGFIDTKSKFQVALDGNGLILQGSPDHLGYEMKQAPIYNTRFGAGDRSYSDFSFWWFWAQTDWAGGIKNNSKWSDDAKFFYSEGVETSRKGGSVFLNWLQTVQKSVSGKDMVFLCSGDVGAGSTAFLILGRNATDGKMRAVDVSDNSTVWEDSTSHANEKILCAADDGQGTLYIGCRTAGSGSSFLKKSTGGSFSDVKTYTGGIGISAIVFYPSNNSFYFFSDTDGIWVYDITADTLTQKKSLFPLDISSDAFFSFGGDGDSAAGIALVGDRIYFLYRERNLYRSQLWAYDIGDDAYVHITTFDSGLYPKLLISRGSNVYMFDDGFNVGTVRILKYDTSTGVVSQIHEVGRSGDSTSLISIPVKDSEAIYFAVDDGSSDFQVWKLDNFDNISSGITPPSPFAADIDYMGMSKTANLIVVINGALNRFDSYSAVPKDKYQTTGFATTSIFDGNIPAIDKLFYSIVINFVKFVSGQAILIEYSTDGGGSFSTLGTASATVDGTSVTSREFFFSQPLVSKTMQLRFTLTGGGSNTPSLEAFSVKHIPLPVYTKLWNLNINCGDEVKRLDGALVETTGRELKGVIEAAWWNKSVLDFQDFDYATTLLDGALNNSATTITVDSTDDFPEQGRLRVDDEEIFYTAKTRTTFTGCTRASRGTVAVSHSDNAVINNAYKVILTDLQYRIPIALKDKELEYALSISLREV